MRRHFSIRQSVTPSQKRVPDASYEVTGFHCFLPCIQPCFSKHQYFLLVAKQNIKLALIEVIPYNAQYKGTARISLGAIFLSPTVVKMQKMIKARHWLVFDPCIKQKSFISYQLQSLYSRIALQSKISEQNSVCYEYWNPWNLNCNRCTISRMIKKSKHKNIKPVHSLIRSHHSLARHARSKAHVM